MKQKDYLSVERLEQEGKMLDWAQVAHFDEIHIEQKAGMETTTGYQIRFLRDDYGKLIKKKGQNGTYKDVGVSFDLIYHQDIKHSFKINPFIFCFCFSRFNGHSSM
mgnify:CR=1 FL=1